MPSPLARLTLALDRFSRAVLWIAASGLVVMTAVIGWQVWGRYVLNDTPHWSEQLSLFLMLYYILLAAAVGVRERFHIGLVVFRDALPPRGRRALDISNDLMVAAFGGGMAWYGTQIALVTWNQTIPTLGLPVGASYLPFSIAGGLIVLFAAENILNTVAGSGTNRS